MSEAAEKINNDGDYRVDLAIFHGPLDLLLYLIKKDEVEIYDIPIAKITRQYLEYIDLMKELNLEVVGDFILMAATLIRIKAKMLLPREVEDGEEVDPREELVAALIEYKKYKEVGEILREKAILEERNYVPPTPHKKEDYKTDWMPATNLFDLLTAFKEVLKERPEDTTHQVELEAVSIQERMKVVLDILSTREYASFIELFSDLPRRIVAVVTFIALLELARARRISISQSRPFAELRIYRGERFQAKQDAIDLVQGSIVTTEESE